VSRIVNLLENGNSIGEIQGELNGQALSVAQQMTGPVNKWIKLQNASKFEERKETCLFINDLLSSCGVKAVYEKTPCYFSLSKGTRYPEGVIYLVPFGEKAELTTRVRFADLPDIELAPALGVEGGADTSKRHSRMNTSKKAGRLR